MALQTKIISANGSKGHHKFTLTVNEDSTNIANNTSSVSWLFQIDPIENRWDWSYTNSVSYSVIINGTTYSGTIDSYDGNSTVVIKRGTNTITHNADGSKSISYSFSVSSLDVSYLPGSASASGTMALTKIPRAATISSAPNFNDEANPKIGISNPAGSAVDKIEVCIANPDGSVAYAAYRDIGSKTATSYTFNLTTAERNKLRSATSTNTLSVRFFIKTTIGGTPYIKQSDLKTMTIVNATPEVNVSFRDGAGFGGLTGSPTSIFIKGISYVSYEITATPKKGATIASYSVENNGTVINASTGTFWSITNSTFNITVKDSRGNTYKKSHTFTLVDYIKPTCTVDGSITLRTDDNTKADINITISGNSFMGSFGVAENILTVQYRYKADNGSYTEWANALDNTIKPTSYESTVSITNLDYQKGYTIQARIQDLIFDASNYKGAVESSTITLKATPVFDWGKDDFSFNVPISIMGEPVADYVIENGTKGIWTYRKWHSGMAECWGTSAVVEADCSGTWGAINNTPILYCKDNALMPISYPFDFTAAPSVQTSFDYAGGYNYWTYTSSEYIGTAKQTPSYGVCRPTAAKVKVKAHYYAIGRWR